MNVSRAPARLALLQLLALLTLCGFGPPRLADRAALPDFEVEPAQLSEIQAERPGPVTAKAALIMQVSDGQVLYAIDGHQPLPPASTTKIMTALLTLEHGDLGDSTTISQRAASEPGTSMYLQAGEQLTLQELLWGLLLPSGNDAAIALAQFEAGSIPAFVARMNARAAELGMKDTHYGDPDGIDDADDRMSVTDVAHLARYALLNEAMFDQIVATKTKVIPAGPSHPEFDLTNLDQLLSSYPGADGVKTGTTPGAGENLVGTATRDGHRMMVVVYGATDRYADARMLLDHAFGDNVWLDAQHYFPYQSALPIGQAGEVLLPGWEASQVQAFLDPAALQASFSLDGQQILAAPLIAPTPASDSAAPAAAAAPAASS